MVSPGVVSRRLSRIRRRLVRRVCRQLYRDPGPELERSIMVAGTGRSGTTWVSDIVASQLPCRVMFEPFHTRQVAACREFAYFQYQRPQEEYPALEAYCRRILTGAIRDPWIDLEVETLRPRWRLIKAIRANLFLKWLTLRFPSVPVVFVLRHPCAVVHSRMQWQWASQGDIEPLLAQDQLVADFLADKMDAIARTTSDEGKHAIVWCISNLVPLRQFAAGELTVVHYENLVARPRIEVPRIFAAIGQPFSDAVFRRIEVPSTTTLSRRLDAGPRDRIDGWTRQLDARQVRDILDVVESFGLGYLYGAAPLPLAPAAASSQSSTAAGGSGEAGSASRALSD